MYRFAYVAKPDSTVFHFSTSLSDEFLYAVESNTPASADDVPRAYL